MSLNFAQVLNIGKALAITVTLSALLNTTGLTFLQVPLNVAHAALIVLLLDAHKPFCYAVGICVFYAPLFYVAWLATLIVYGIQAPAYFAGIGHDKRQVIDTKSKK